MNTPQGQAPADTNTASGAADLIAAAQAVVARWDTPLWKDVPATAEYIGRLRAALAFAPAQPADIENLRKALQFYADKGHFGLSDESAWDTVSGEPQNYWCDEAGTATVEDGSIARLALAGHPIQLEGAAAPSQTVAEPAQVSAVESHTAVAALPDCGEAGHSEGCCGSSQCLPSASRRQAPAGAAPERVADPLSEFQDGQWWMLELDGIASKLGEAITVTHDMLRAVAVVRHLLRAVRETEAGWLEDAAR